MAETRVTAVEMHAKLGATIDRAVIEPVIITKHGRDYLVMLSAERYAALVAADVASQSSAVAAPVSKLAGKR